MGNNFNKHCTRNDYLCKKGYGIDYDVKDNEKNSSLCKPRLELDKKEADFSKFNLDTCSCFSNGLNSCMFFYIIISCIIYIIIITLFFIFNKRR